MAPPLAVESSRACSASPPLPPGEAFDSPLEATARPSPNLFLQKMKN